MRQRYVELVRVGREMGKPSVGKVEGKRGDVASGVAAALQSFPCRGNPKAVES